MNTPAMTRAGMIKRLDEPFDLMVIGGGITGAGAARDAARRGLRVVLIEQDDLASGTSSRSSKLVHGGLRYLERGEFSLVFEAVHERRILQEIAPHLVNPLGFLFPVYRGSRRGVFAVNIGMWLYEGLSLFRSPKIHRNLSPTDVATEVPLLKRKGLKGAPLYYDCATDDARLTLETAIDAGQQGAVIATHVRVDGLLSEGGRVVGAKVRDRLDGTTSEVRASAVINATGPWSDRTRSFGVGGGKPRLRPTKGIHVVIDADRLSVDHAVVCFHPVDGRVLFAIPWGDRTYIGTTDTDYSGPPEDVVAERADVTYLLDATNHYFPGAQLRSSDVISTWAGVRPLIAEGEAGDESAVSREHEIRIDPDGLITIAGGKLTTYRRMGAEVVDKAVGLLMMLGKLPGELSEARTDLEPLPGAVGWPEDDDHDAVAAQVAAAGEGKLSAASARLLGNTYGMRAMDLAHAVASDPDKAQPLIPGRPEIVAQVDYAVTREFAATLNDVMVRRTQLYLRDRDQGLGASEAIASRMAGELNWDEERVSQEVAAYRATVAGSRRWQVGSED